MTKEKFCKIINELEEAERLQNKIASAVRQYNSIIKSDYPEPFGMVITHDFTVIELLKEIMDDEFDDIYFYCNNLEYGKKYVPGDVLDSCGNEVELKTAGDLYDYLETQRKDKDKLNEES